MQNAKLTDPSARWAPPLTQGREVREYREYREIKEFKGLNDFIGVIGNP
jgi:hypothetical protein